MNNLQWWHEPFFQVGLPVIVTFVASTWYQGKRLDDLRADFNKRMDEVNKRLDEIIRRLERVETKLDTHAERIAKLEERTGPIRGGR